jgi:hypothetical protein
VVREEVGLPAVTPEKPSAAQAQTAALDPDLQQVLDAEFAEAVRPQVRCVATRITPARSLPRPPPHLRWLATARMPPDRSALRLVPLRQKQLERSVDELVSDLSVPFISVLQARARVSQSGSG